MIFQETRNRVQSASSYFRKFAQDNIGSNFRKPEPKDEDSRRANDIFKKYSSSSSTRSSSSTERCKEIN